MLCKIKKKPNFSIGMGKENALQCDHIRMLQLSEKLNKKYMKALSEGLITKIW